MRSMRKKKKWKVFVAVCLCIALVGGTVYFAGGRDILKTKADSYSENEKGAPKDRQGLLSSLIGNIPGLSSLFGGGGGTSNALSSLLSGNGLSSIANMLGNGSLGSLTNLLSGGDKSAMVKNLIQTAMSWAQSLTGGGSRQSSLVVNDIKKIRNSDGTKEYEVAYTDKEGKTPYGYAVLGYDKDTKGFCVNESCINKGQKDLYSSLIGDKKDRGLRGALGGNCSFDSSGLDSLTNFDMDKGSGDYSFGDEIFKDGFDYGLNVDGYDGSYGFDGYGGSGGGCNGIGGFGKGGGGCNKGGFGEDADCSGGISGGSFGKNGGCNKGGKGGFGKNGGCNKGGKGGFGEDGNCSGGGCNGGSSFGGDISGGTSGGGCSGGGCSGLDGLGSIFDIFGNNMSGIFDGFNFGDDSDFGNGINFDGGMDFFDNMDNSGFDFGNGDGSFGGIDFNGFDFGGQGGSGGFDWGGGSDMDGSDWGGSDFGGGVSAADIFEKTGNALDGDSIVLEKYKQRPELMDSLESEKKIGKYACAVQASAQCAYMEGFTDYDSKLKSTYDKLWSYSGTQQTENSGMNGVIYGGTLMQSMADAFVRLAKENGKSSTSYGRMESNPTPQWVAQNAKANKPMIFGYATTRDGNAAHCISLLGVKQASQGGNDYKYMIVYDSWTPTPKLVNYSAHRFTYQEAAAFDVK